jgi:hypothetical protein
VVEPKLEQIVFVQIPFSSVPSFIIIAAIEFIGRAGHACSVNREENVVLKFHGRGPLPSRSNVGSAVDAVEPLTSRTPQRYS